MSEAQQPKPLPRRRPEAGAIRVVGLVGRLDIVRVVCAMCDRVGRYTLAWLIERYGPGMGLPDRKDQFTADCPLRAKPSGTSDICGAHFPDLSEVM
jgi:hypothetical protein